MPSNSNTSHAPQADTPLPRITKRSQVIELLQRTDGATLRDLTRATGWQSHSARAALTGLRQKGYAIEKTRRGEETCYRITGDA